MPTRPQIMIHAARCKKCGLCVEICPEELFARTDSQAVPTTTRTAKCTLCGHCASICRTGAIEHSAFPPESRLPENSCRTG